MDYVSRVYRRLASIQEIINLRKEFLQTQINSEMAAAEKLIKKIEIEVGASKAITRSLGELEDIVSSLPRDVPLSDLEEISRAMMSARSCIKIGDIK